MPFSDGTLIAALACGLLLFVVPGALLVRASGAVVPRAELPGWALAGSLSVLFVCFAAVVALGLPLLATLWPLGAVIAVATVRSVRTTRRAAPTLSVAAARSTAMAGSATAAQAAQSAETAHPAQAAQRTEPAGRDGDAPLYQMPAAAVPGNGQPRWWPLLVALVVVAATFAASHFASVGSIDRWWYLAYVRGYLESDVLRITEPFLGTERVFARFGVHPWLMGLALWSKMSGADPVWLYERIAPVFAIPAAAAATMALARALFGYGATARAAVFATLLSWSGGLLPVLARAGEDKVLAQAALASLCLAACLNAVRGERGALVLVAIAAIATATVHGLVFAFVLAAWLPFAILRGLHAARERPALIATAVFLLIVAAQPAALGLMVESSLRSAGAVTQNADHPVLRVHESRGRTIDAGRLGFIVHPRLLAHPISLLALGAVPLLLRRRRDLTRDFLLASTATASLIAFVPPIPALAGTVIPGWMVYRVLWVIPLASLAAFGARELGKRVRFGETATLGLLLAICALPIIWSLEQRAGEERARRAIPSSTEFAAAMRAVAELPSDALVAAAPQLAERLPALTGRHIVAGLDRSTIMFSGSRDVGEARLRLRATTLVGDLRGGAPSTEGALRPTHALFDPRSAARPICTQLLFSVTRYALCSLAEVTQGAQTLSLQRIGDEAGDLASPLPAGAPEPQWISTRGNSGSRCTASCTPPGGDEFVAASQPEDWEAAAPVVNCRIECTNLAGAAPASIEAFEILPQVGRAVDHLLLRARCFGRGNEISIATGSARTDGDAPIRFVVPHTPAAPIDTVDLRITSGLLPFVRLRDVTWGVGDDAVVDAP